MPPPYMWANNDILHTRVKGEMMYPAFYSPQRDYLGGCSLDWVESILCKYKDIFIILGINATLTHQIGHITTARPRNTWGRRKGRTATIKKDHHDMVTTTGESDLFLLQLNEATSRPWLNRHNSCTANSPWSLIARHMRTNVWISQPPQAILRISWHGFDPVLRHAPACV